MSEVTEANDSLFKFYLNDVFYTPSYDVTDAYFAEKTIKLNKSSTDKEAIYEMSNHHLTGYDKVFDKDTVNYIIKDINANIQCKASDVLSQLEATSFKKSGYAQKDETISNIPLYCKDSVVALIDYPFTGNIIDLSTTAKKQSISKAIATNIQNANKITQIQVENALKSSGKKRFETGDILSDVANDHKMPTLRSYFLDTPKPKINYTFVESTEVYQDSAERKKVINEIVEAINNQEKQEQKDNIYYETNYEYVDAKLPEEVFGKKDDTKQTKLNIQLIKVEIEEVYTKIDKASIGSTVQIVVETQRAKDLQVDVKIYEKEPILQTGAKPLCLLKSDIIKAVSNGKGKAIAQVILRPSSDKDFEQWKEAFKPKEAKAEIIDKLYLSVSDVVRGEEEFLKGDEFELNSKVINLSRTPLMELISSKESKGSYSAYNVTGWDDNGKNKVYESHFEAQGTYLIESMTIQEIKVAQKTKVGINKKHLFAVGRYQLIPTTLNISTSWINRKINIDIVTQKFDKAFQDLLPIYFWESKVPIISQYFKDSATSIDAAYGISKEWASAGVPKGKALKNGLISNGNQSFYSGDGLNSAHYSAEKTINALEETRKIINQHGGYDIVFKKSLTL